MAKGKIWTQEDIDMLAELRKRGVSREVIAIVLDRSVDAINSMEWKIGNLDGWKLKEESKVVRNSNKNLPLDGEKLRWILRDKHISHDKAGEVTGYGRKTVDYWLNTGYIPKSAMAVFTNVYGIKYEDVKPSPKEKPKQEFPKQEEQTRDDLQVQEVRVSRETLALFRNMMCAAVYEGVKKALNEQGGRNA